jgi:hypothetical protein
MKKQEEHEERHLQRQLPLKGSRRRDPCAEMPIKLALFIRAIRVIRGGSYHSPGRSTFNPDAVPDAAVSVQAISAPAISARRGLDLTPPRRRPSATGDGS